MALLARYLGAATLLAVGLDHLEQLTLGHYSAIPTIGTLFALNFASAVLVALGLATPWQRLGERADKRLPPLLEAGGIGIVAGSLTALLVSESTPLFGFRETGYRGAIVVAIALDVATILLLGACLVATAPRTAALRGAHRAAS